MLDEQGSKTGLRVPHSLVGELIPPDQKILPASLEYVPFPKNLDGKARPDDDHYRRFNLRKF
jgi:hypothetical protein